MNSTTILLVAMFVCVAQAHEYSLIKSNTYYNVCDTFIREADDNTKATTACFYFSNGPDCRQPTMTVDDVPDADKVPIAFNQCKTDAQLKQTANGIFNQQVNAIVAGKR